MRAAQLLQVPEVIRAEPRVHAHVALPIGGGGEDPTSGLKARQPPGSDFEIQARDVRARSDVVRRTGGPSRCPASVSARRSPTRSCSRRRPACRRARSAVVSSSRAASPKPETVDEQPAEDDRSAVPADAHDGEVCCSGPCRSRRPACRACRCCSARLSDRRLPHRMGILLAVVGEANAPAEEQLHLARLPTVNSPAFSRKNGRFSGKNRLKRSRLTCWSSTSTCAKVGVHRRVECKAWSTCTSSHPPTSPRTFPPVGCRSTRGVGKSVGGHLQSCARMGTVTPDNVPASDTR